jgi:PPOX class probable F420-dependent enzyme
MSERAWWRWSLVVGSILGTFEPGAAALSPETEAALRSSDYIYVATERKDGSRSAAAPIWFVFDGGKIFFTTAPDAWKAKRIAAGSPLYITVGTKNGPALVGSAEPVTDAEVVDRMGRAYSDKYWIAWLGLFRPRRARVSSGRTKAYLVTITETPAGR